MIDFVNNANGQKIFTESIMPEIMHMVVSYRRERHQVNLPRSLLVFPGIRSVAALRVLFVFQTANICRTLPPQVQIFVTLILLAMTVAGAS